MGAALGVFRAAVKYKYQTLLCKERARRDPSSSSVQFLPGLGFSGVFGGVGGEGQAGCAELSPGDLSLFGKAPAGEGQGINAVYKCSL